MRAPLGLPFIDGRRDRRVGELIFIVWLLGLSDLFFTLWANQFTPFFELNPLVRPLLQDHLLPSLVLYKLVLTALGTLIFWRLRRFARVELSLWMLVGIYVLLLLRWSNYTLGALAYLQ